MYEDGEGLQLHPVPRGWIEWMALAWTNNVSKVMEFLTCVYKTSLILS